MKNIVLVFLFIVSPMLVSAKGSNEDYVEEKRDLVYLCLLYLSTEEIDECYKQNDIDIDKFVGKEETKEKVK